MRIVQLAQATEKTSYEGGCLHAYMSIYPIKLRKDLKAPTLPHSVHEQSSGQYSTKNISTYFLPGRYSDFWNCHLFLGIMTLSYPIIQVIQEIMLLHVALSIGRG